SGVIPGCSHYVRDDPDDRRHIADRVAEQLVVAGIPETKPADVGWLTGDIGHFDLPPSHALLVPGGAPHRPEKRAPAEAFAGVGRHLIGQGIAPVLLGTDSERDQIDAIAGACPGAIDLSDRTSFGEIAELARHATGAVGNDTGAIHLAAAVGCPSLVLFSAASDPSRVRPRAVGQCRDERPPHRPSLGDDGPEGLVPARQEADVAGLQQCLPVLAPAEKMYPLSEAELARERLVFALFRAVAGDAKMRVRQP